MAEGKVAACQTAEKDMESRKGKGKGKRDNGNGQGQDGFSRSRSRDSSRDKGGKGCAAEANSAKASSKGYEEERVRSGRREGRINLRDPSLTGERALLQEVGFAIGPAVRRLALEMGVLNPEDLSSSESEDEFADSGRRAF